MYIFKKRAVSVLLAALMFLVLLPAFPAATSAFSLTAIGTNTVSLTITQSDTEAAIGGIINDLLKGENDSGNNSLMSEYNTVVVTGSKTDSSRHTILDIEAGKKVVWQAEYSDKDKPADVVSLGPGMINLQPSGGTGIFEVAEGANIHTPSNACIHFGNATVLVTGGILKGPSVLYSVDPEGRVEVSGGLIESTSYGSIYNAKGDILVTGGTIKSDRFAISSAGNMTVTGGRLEAGFRTITTSHGSVTITGGEIMHTGAQGEAIYVNGYSSGITVSGGTIISENSTAISIKNNPLEYDEPEDAPPRTTGSLSVSGSAVIEGGFAGIVSVGGPVIVTGGAITKTGTHDSSDSAAISLYEEATAKITGGMVDGGSGPAIMALDSAAAYLESTCKGMGSPPFASFYGCIVEVDTLLVPESRKGTSIGLTRVAGTGEAEWDNDSLVPLINFSKLGEDESITAVIDWGRFRRIASSDPITSSSTNVVPKTGDDTNMFFWGIALALSIAGVCVLPIVKKRMSK